MSRWKPKGGDTYYWIRISLFGFEIISDVWVSPNSFELQLLKDGNCFRIRKEAEQMLKQIKQLLKGK